MNFLSQAKLTKKEWDNIERPISDEREKVVLKMINSCSTDEHSVVLSLKEYLKLGDNFDEVIYHGMLASKINKYNKEDCLQIDSYLKKIVKGIKKISKKDKYRIQNSIEKFDTQDINSTRSIIDLVVVDIIRIVSKIFIFKF